MDAEDKLNIIAINPSLRFLHQFKYPKPSMDKLFSDYKTRLAVLEASNGPFAKGVAWVEGELVPFHEARIPLQDQGFLHGDLTYDVPAVWDGRFFRLDDHLARLKSSCGKMRMKLPLPCDEIKPILFEMLAKSGIKDAFVELIVTRGFKGVRESKLDDFVNNLYMFIVPYTWVMEPEMQYHGGSAVITRTVRRTPPGSFDPTVKNLQWGDLTRGIIEARDRGSRYPFLTDGDAHLTEGSGYNIIVVKDGVLFTPARGVLEGITRRSVFDVARANDIEVRVEFVPTELAYQADEVFMCTTAGGIMPVTELDGKPVKDGKIGPVTKKIWDGYWAMHYDPVYTTEVKYNI